MEDGGGGDGDGGPLLELSMDTFLTVYRLFSASTWWQQILFGSFEICAQIIYVVFWPVKKLKPTLNKLATCKSQASKMPYLKTTTDP